MSKFGKIVGMLALAAGAAALGLSALVFIPSTEAGSNTGSLKHGGRSYCGEAGLEAAAEQLGMTAEELSTQLWGGETLANLADEAGVDLQAVKDAVEAACQAAIRDAIEQAVTDGDLTREHADWLLEGLDNGYWGRGSGFGFGFGPRGSGGFRHFGRFRFNAPASPGSDA